jgi:hypothetical protein
MEKKAFPLSLRIAGWVERSETQHIQNNPSLRSFKVDASVFALLYPTYSLISHGCPEGNVLLKFM